MELQGYCIIKKDQTSAGGIAPKMLQTFLTGQPLRVMEFTPEGDVLVVNSEGSAAGMFDAKDVVRSFKCTFSGEVICPPGLNILQQMEYMSKCMLRNGGYNHIVRNLVIASSLHRGQFCDSVLWAKEKSDKAGI